MDKIPHSTTRTLPKQKLSEFFKVHDWTKGAFAKDDTGCIESVLSPNACSFCMVGALYAMQYDANERKIIQDKFKNHTGSPMMVYNDTTNKSQEELIQLLEEIGI